MERGEIRVHPRITERIELPNDLGEGMMLAVKRRRVRMKLSDVSAQTGITSVKLGAMERGTRSVDPAYRKFLERRS